MAEAVKAGIVAAGGQADILQYVSILSQRQYNGTNLIIRVPETLPQEVLTLMHAPAKPDYPVLTLDKFTTYDGFVFGIPTRYGMMPAQWKVSPYCAVRVFDVGR